MSKLMKVLSISFLSFLLVTSSFSGVIEAESEDASITQNLEDIGVDTKKIPKLIEKIKRGEILDSLNEKMSYIEPISVTTKFDGSVTEKYIFPDGSIKVLEMIPESYEINGVTTSASDFFTKITTEWSQSGSGYATKKMKISGSYGIITMSFYSNVTYLQNGTTMIDSAYDGGHLGAGPGVKVTITQKPTVVKSRPSGSGDAEANMRATIAGDYYTGTYVLRFFVKPAFKGNYASFGIN